MCIISTVLVLVNQSRLSTLVIIIDTLNTIWDTLICDYIYIHKLLPAINNYIYLTYIHLSEESFRWPYLNFSISFWFCFSLTDTSLFILDTLNQQIFYGYSFTSPTLILLTKP